MELDPEIINHLRRKGNYRQAQFFTRGVGSVFLYHVVCGEVATS